MGERTFALFIDFKKAYDRVPHFGLFAKIQQFGVQGRALQFIEALYANSRIRVRVGRGDAMAVSDSFPLL